MRAVRGSGLPFASWCGQFEDWGRHWDPNEGLTSSARTFINSARRDGIPLSEDGELTTMRAGLALPLDRYSPLTETAAVQDGLARIERNLEEDRYVAIGSCKELVETVCKHVLEDYGVPGQQRGWCT